MVLRLFGTGPVLPTTSYGFVPPAGATARGWRCPGCSMCGDEPPRRWPFPCPECRIPTDPELDEPWAHTARGPWLRHRLDAAEPDLRHMWAASLLAWQYRDALGLMNPAVAEAVRALGHQFVQAHVGHQFLIHGDLHHPVVQDSLDHDLFDVAANELAFWNQRVVVEDVENDNTRRTNCRLLLSAMLSFLEHPAGARHRDAPAVRRAAAGLRDAIRDVLTADLDRRARHLGPGHFRPAAPPAAIPQGPVDQLAVFGRYSFDPMGSDLDGGDVYRQIVAPRYERALADSERFCRDLAGQALPVGGWVVYGAQRLVVELLGGEYRGADFLAMQDAALEWLRSTGVPSARLTGYEMARWASTHGAEPWTGVPGPEGALAHPEPVAHPGPLTWEDHLAEALTDLVHRSRGFFGPMGFSGLIRDELAGHLRPHDRPDLFAPAIFEIDADPDPTPPGSTRRPVGKLKVGAAVTLADRVVFMWQEGVIRLRTDSVVLSYHSIAAVTEVTYRVKGDDIRGLEVLADRRRPILFTNNYSDMSFWRDMLRGRLSGAFQPDWDERGGQ